MMFTRKKERKEPAKPRSTSVSFSAQDLTELGHLIAAGRVVLQRNAPVVARLKAAMTRLGVAIPKGL